MMINDQVKTNDFYMNNGYGFKRSPLKLGTVINVRDEDNQTIIEVKTKNGRMRSYNKLFLELA